MSSSGANTTASGRETRTAAGVGIYRNMNEDEDEREEEDDQEDDDGEDDDDDEDDAEEEDDDDEGKERGDADTNDHKIPRASSKTGSKQADATPVNFKAKEPNVTTSSVWGNGNTEQNVLFDPRCSYSETSPLAFGNWASNTPDNSSYNSMYPSNSPSFLGFGQNALASAPNSRATSTNAPYSTYGIFPLRSLCVATSVLLTCAQA